MPTVALLDKFHHLKRTLADETVERLTEIHLIVVALIGGSHLFFLSAPGRAKSFLVDRTVQRIEGARYFDILLNPTIKPEQVFGPLDIAGLRESPSRFEHQIEGFLPWCDIYMGDEFWKLNGALLNGHLGIFNERKFKNGRHTIPVNLSTAFIASNETAQGAELAAIDDRVGLRIQVGDVIEDEAFIRMLELEVEENPPKILTWAEILTAKAEAAALPIARDVRVKTAELRRELREEGIEPTPRRWKQLDRVLRAEAWLDGADEVTTDHLVIAEHSLWTKPEEHAKLRPKVIAKANPLEKEILELMAGTSEIEQAIEKAKRRPRDASTLGDEINELMVKAKEDFEVLAAKAGSSRRNQEALGDVKRRLHDLTVRMIRDVFHLNPDTVQANV